MLQLFLPIGKKSLFTSFELCICARETRAPQGVVAGVGVQQRAEGARNALPRAPAQIPRRRLGGASLGMTNGGAAFLRSALPRTARVRKVAGSDSRYRLGYQKGGKRICSLCLAGAVPIGDEQGDCWDEWPVGGFSFG